MTLNINREKTKEEFNNQNDIFSIKHLFPDNHGRKSDRYVRSCACCIILICWFIWCFFYILLLLAQYKCLDVVELLKCQLYPTVVRCLFDKKIRIHPFYKIHVYVIAFYVIYITVHVFMKILIRVRTSKLFLISIDMKLNLIKSNFFTICNFFFNSKFKKKKCNLYFIIRYV